MLSLRLALYPSFVRLVCFLSERELSDLRSLSFRSHFVCSWSLRGCLVSGDTSSLFDFEVVGLLVIPKLLARTFDPCIER